MARVRSRLLLALAATTCLGAVHCVSDEPAVPTGNNDGGVTEGGDGDGGGGASTDGAPLGDAASGTIDVNGMLGTGGSPPAPIANRALAIIDSTDAVFKTTSAADGTFHVSDPVVYGMPTDVGTSTNPDPPMRSAPIHFTANACVGCTIWVSGPSTGFNQAGTGASNAYADYPYRWFATAPTLATTLHFYFQDATGEFTGYDDETVTLTDGAAADLGTIPPSPIPTNPTLAVNATLPGSYTYERTTLSFYDADGSRLAYMNPTTTSSTTKIPAMPGVRIDLTAYATGPDGNSESSASVNWPDYTAVPNTLAIPLPEVPTAIGPADKATGITNAQKLTFTPWSLKGTYYIAIAENNGLSLTVQTMTPEVDLARLAKAGLTLTPGHVYSWHYAATTTQASMDDMVKPGGAPVAAQGTLKYLTRGIYRTFTMQ